jgi:hypothetical protein
MSAWICLFESNPPTFKMAPANGAALGPRGGILVRAPCKSAARVDGGTKMLEKQVRPDVEELRQLLGLLLADGTLSG